METLPKLRATASMRRALAHLVLGLQAGRVVATGTVFAAAALASPTLFAQAATGTVSGQVSNTATRQYLVNAEVRLVGTDRVVITGVGGNYSFSGVPAGETKVSATYTGLDPIEQSVTVSEGQTAKLDFGLTSGRYGETVQLDTFRVSTAREGNAKAISDQKFALNVKTVISSDTFGDVPEGNLGEFLKLLPGITVDFVEADVRNIRVRGLPPKYATITFDGHPIANSGSSDLTRLRALEMEQVSLATVETVEVNKSPTADMSSPGLGGNINTVGKSAFSQKGRSIKYSLSAVMNDYHMSLGEERGWDDKSRRHIFPNFSFEYMDTFLDGRLGVVAAVMHSGSFMQQKILNNTLAFNTIAGDDMTELPTYTTIQLRDGPKPTWRDSAVVNLDFKATPDLTFKLRTSYGEYDAQFFNKDFNFITTAAIVGARTSDRSQTSTAPAITNTTSRTTISSSNSRKMGETAILSPSVEWKKGDLTVEASGSYSKSVNDYNTTEEGYFRTVTAQMNGVSWKYDLPGEKDFKITQLPTGAGDTRNIYDLGNYNGAALSLVGADPRHAKGQIWSGRVDATYDLDRLSMPTTIKVGVMHRQDVYDVIQSYGTNFTVPIAALNSALASGATNINLREFDENYQAYVDKGVTVTDIAGATRNWHPTIDNFRLFQFFKQYVTDFEGITAPTSGPFVAATAANLRGKLQSDGDIDERQKSAYAMTTVKITPKLTALGGVRFETTTTSGKSFDDIGNTQAVARSGTTNTNDAGYIYARYGSRITRTREYDNVLPSAQLRYAPTRNIVTRAAYFKSLMRPDYSQLTGGIAVSNDIAPFAFTRKNIDLQPETADNFELGFEYYFEPVGVVSANFFYKKIHDIQIANAFLIDPNNIPQDIADLGYTAGALGNDSTVATRVNAGEANLKGLELSYSQELTFLPGPFSGLGVTANATFVELSDQDLFLSAVAGGDGTSKVSGNFIVRYGIGRFKTQLTTTYTDDTARALTIAAAGNRYNYTAARVVFGLNMEYKVHKFASVFLNVSNLTNEPQTRYDVRELNIQRDGDYGTTFNLGVKGRF
ncbi:TonB-dependent receptor [Oleiharenicola lentus]|uniref:TonB-dependent receptor n=1 Tax=Oleiharenicola lentus TaxID=2508720 RepID=UPI003F66C2A3